MVSADVEYPSSSSESSLASTNSSENGSWKPLVASNEKWNYLGRSNQKIFRRRWFRILTFFLGSIILALIIWMSLLLSLSRHHRPKAPSNKISSIVDVWKKPTDSIDLLSPWDSDFSRGVTPLSCHSHNDYKQGAPLFKALAAGCMGVEADIHLPSKNGSKDLLVGHKTRSLRSDRTLQSLYIGPLTKVLENLNDNSTTNNETNGWNGVFQSSPNTTLTLLLDFKSNGADLWPYVNQHLDDLRSKNWLTHWNGSSGLTWAPLIIVATGNAPFDLLNSNKTYRDIFYDAPLNDITNPIYDNTNSYYASTSMYHTIGQQWLWKFSSSQLTKINAQIAAASRKGLISRYWDTPSWPVTFKEYIFGVLVENRIGLLNVDVFSSTLYYPLVTRFGGNKLEW
ncbi:PLC-like phosphodiesterase [Glarea lozoyensis ATCC 20868]|uniref:Altered inheritance of mitochondria protein 6 n=1 Tax=Glarea lozoyensis (strain ATCC 20868 / MF5171) TaxID=1116229 RepID=S3D7S1_GLAL2|nr:PLC-like phosphodiesterase [Glarea lozoyensis ATCC 20868]EPE28061.1 PLC-like phosphodiesterase [Glarea lozoyensis ATCC 20868]